MKNLENIPSSVIPIYGDLTYRGKCLTETAEQIWFFNWLKENYRDIYRIAIHPKNEGKRTWSQISTESAMGALNKGASDIVIPTRIPFICEMKRRDQTKSDINDDQVDYLTCAHKAGAYVCIALGAEAAIDAFEFWIEHYHKK